MLTNFIKIPKIKEILDTNFEFIKIAKPLLDNFSIDNPSIIGNAIELYFNCLFDIYHPVSKKNYKQNKFPITLNEQYIKPLTQIKKETIFNFYELSKSIEYLKDKFEDGITQLLHQDFSQGKEIKSLSEFISKIEINIPHKNFDIDILEKISIYSQAENKIKDFIDCEYRKYLQYGTLTKDFIKQFLLIAQISPSLNFLFLNNLNDKITQNDYIAFEKIISKIPINFFSNIYQLDYHRKLRCGNVDAKTDFITNDAIIEIKATKDFYTKSHLRQVIGYYLMHLYDIEKINHKNSITDIRRLSKIKRIIIYYALYGVIVEISVNKITDKSKIIKAYNEFIEFAELMPTQWI